MSDTSSDGKAKTFAVTEDESAMTDFIWIAVVIIAIAVPMWVYFHHVSQVIFILSLVGAGVVLVSFINQVSTEVRQISIDDTGVTVETTSNKHTVPWGDVQSIDQDYKKGESAYIQVTYKDGEFLIPADMENSKEAADLIQARLAKKSS